MAPEYPLLAGRYRLLDRLGRGGMGIVWRARDELLGRPVAVKEVLVPPELPEEERDVLRRRTLREARSAARLAHPNVVMMYDVVEDDGRPWLVMELVASRTLGELIHERGRLPWREVAGIGLEVLAALQAAHSAGVLHRDVKPSNVLLADDGRVVLTDFGIASLEGDASLTRSGALVGSPAFIAPERVQARGAVPESDLWSLGATLYTAVEGRSPFDRGSAFPTLAAAVAEPPDPAPHAGPLWPVIEGLLTKDPASRMKAAEATRLLRLAMWTPDVATSATDRSAAPTREPAPSVAQRPWEDSNRDSGQRTRLLPIASFTPESDPPAQPVRVPPAAGNDSSTGDNDGHGSPPEAAPVAGPPNRIVRTVLPAAVACLLVLTAVAGWAMMRQSGDSSGDKPAAQSTQAGQASRSTSTAQRPPSASPTANTTRTATPTRTTRAPTATPSPSITPSPSAQPSTPVAAVPAGFERHRDPTGFSVAVPNGWTSERGSGPVYFREPSGSGLLIIDQTDRPKADPVADWRQQEAARRSGYTDYHRIRIEAVNYFDKAADWEFTYAARSGRQHVLIRGVVTSPNQAYGIYWSTPDAQWQQNLPALRTILKTFQPAS
ncbi:serine/threonine-protein kinase [Kribbella pratensis]|uniref:non-specific serine/threonine protein kinase n=1 Tax=Kribbella pratensis TaxID=2512112 RepID=A0A4R8CGC0_9ACTN|nr:serine/threonine-protein kinase [Kribbella pratensis]TDW75389.1 serine/threonine protein kinase [Kribbella pratensis]